MYSVKDANWHLNFEHFLLWNYSIDPTIVAINVRMDKKKKKESRDLHLSLSHRSIGSLILLLLLLIEGMLVNLEEKNCVLMCVFWEKTLESFDIGKG